MSHINEIVPDTIELLSNDGKVTANRAFLRLASPAIHKQLMENPEITIFDMKNHKKTTIDHLLHGNFSGKLSFTVTDEGEKEMVMSLAQELDINITQTSELAGEAPKMSEEPEEQSKDVGPKLTRLNDGRVSCDVCFKIFSGRNAMSNANFHFQVHLSSDKNINCRFQGCDKKFANMTYMKTHMRKSHGILPKQITSITKTTKTKSSTSFTKLTKKAIKKEAPKKVIKEEHESIED